MTPPTFLVDALTAADTVPGAVVELGGDEGRHAARVRRIGTGETVRLGDGRGRAVEGVVVAVLPDGLQLRVSSSLVEPEPSPRLVAVQALAKGDRGELAVETMTELGVDAIVPWSASRSIVQWHGERGERSREKWQRTAREAAKQSRRLRVPEVGTPVTTAALADRVAAAAATLVLHEAASQPLVDVVLPAAGEVLVVIGPEGGIAPDELERLQAAGALPVRLGTPVLRTSTAGAAALAALSVRLGRWS